MSNTRGRILLYNIIQMLTHGHVLPNSLMTFCSIMLFWYPLHLAFLQIGIFICVRTCLCMLVLLDPQNLSKSKCLIFKVLEKWPISHTKISQITKNISMYLFNCFCGGCLLATWVKQATCKNAINIDSL